MPVVTARHHLRLPFPLPLAKMLAAALLGLSIGCLVALMMPGPMSEAERRRHLAAAAAEARVAARGSVGTEAPGAEERAPGGGGSPSASCSQPVPPGSVGAEAGAAERRAHGGGGGSAGASRSQPTLPPKKCAKEYAAGSAAQTESARLPTDDGEDSNKSTGWTRSSTSKNNRQCGAGKVRKQAERARKFQEK